MHEKSLSEKKYPVNILKDNEFEKSRDVLAARRKSLVHQHGKGNKPQPACSGHRRRRRGCPFWRRRIRRPQSSCASRNCTSVCEQENISHPSLSSTPPVFQYRCKRKIHQRVHIPKISWLCENCPEWKEASNCYRERWGRLTFKLFLSTLYNFELIFTASNFDFHFTLTCSIFCNQQSIVWSTRNPFSNFRISNYFCQMPLQSVFV